MGTSHSPCDTNEDCNTGAGLSCQQSTCQCSISNEWDSKQLSCDKCAPNYIKQNGDCGFGLFFF